MQKAIFYLILLVSFSKAFSQVNDNCINAIPLCSTPSFTFFTNSGPGSIIDFSTTSTISNPLTNPFPPNIGCLNSGELNPQWLILTIGNAGLLEFVFGAGNSANPQAGYYDWSMWPYSPTTCAGIFNNTLPPVRCNWNGTSAGGTGLGSSTTIAAFNGNSNNFGNPLQVNACQQFVICISNFSGVNTLVSFLSLGSASLSCSPNCNPNYAICSGSSATIIPVNFAALTGAVYSLQPLGLSNTTGSFVVTPTVTSSYTTYITGLNSVNAVQTLTATSTVTVNGTPSAAPTVTNTTCTSTLNAVNLNLTFNPIGSAPVYTINWSPIPAGIGNSSQTSFTGGIGPGLYQATVTTAAGCTTTTGFSVNPIPDPAIISLIPLGNSHTITCFQPVITVTALVSSLNYTWSSNVAVFNGPVVAFTSTDVANWTIVAQNPISGCVSTQTVAIYQNTVTPSGTVTPLSQNITCNINSITTITATANPSVNITHQFMSPQGGTFSAQSYTVPYLPGSAGIFTHCVVNDANGCSTCNTFSVFSSQGFPTFNVTSPQNFTLGCNSTSCAIIKIENGNTTPSGGAVTYTLLAPGGSSVTPTGSLSANAIYTTCTPGTWTVITKDNSTFCETRVAISVLSNTFAPDISAIVPRQILDCNVPKITLQGQSLTNNVSYVWGFPASPGTLVGDTITVISVSATPNNSFIANYTLTITDNNSTCKSFSIIPMYQNLYPPKALISNGGTSSISCTTGTITLTNQSSTSIPPTSGFTYQLPVIGYIWDGPSPQEPGQVNTTYIAATVGIYTLTAKDLNNGCISKATTTITDNRFFPTVNKPTAPPSFTLDCGSATRTISPYIVGPTAGFTYSWSSALGATISGVNSPILTTNKIGNYRLLITNTVNGCSSFGDVYVVNGQLNATFEAQPIKGFAPLPVTFYNNSASSLGSSSITAYWNFGNATTSVTTESNLSPVTTYSLPGTYKVTMFANKGTCMDTLSLNIEVEIPSVMEIPNVFTPNGDNVNDLFFLKASNLETITIHIYDRWGHIVYISESEHGNIEWDGKYQSGKQAADGTYFYLIKAMGKDGKAYDKKGTVSLYR